MVFRGVLGKFSVWGADRKFQFKFPFTLSKITYGNEILNSFAARIV
jgi:hypothetical protein